MASEYRMFSFLVYIKDFIEKTDILAEKDVFQKMT